jgi:hypothetical protein
VSLGRDLSLGGVFDVQGLRFDLRLLVQVRPMDLSISLLLLTYYLVVPS